MKRIFNNHSHRLFLRFMLSYLMVLLIPLIIGGLTYNEALRLVNQNLRDLNLAVLKQSRDVLDKQLEEVGALVQQVLINPRINGFLETREPLSADDYYQMKKVLDEIGPYTITRNFIADFLVYFKNSNYIFSSETVYKVSLFKERFGDNQALLDELRREVYRRGDYFPATRVSLNGKNIPVIPYVRSMPFTPDLGRNNMEGTMMVLLKDAEVRKLLTRADIKGGGWAYIADRDGKVITGVSGGGNPVAPVGIAANEGFIQQKVAGEKMIVTYTTSPFNGWKYVAVMPARLALAKVDFIRTILIIFIAGSLLIGTFLAYYLTHHNTLPLQKISKALSESIEFRPAAGADTYQFLQGSIAQLINSNRSLQETIRQQRPLIRAAFFDQVLNRGFNNPDEMRAILSYLGLDRRPERYRMIVVQLYDGAEMLNQEIIQELDMTKVVVKDVIQRQLGERGYLHDIDANKLAVLLTWNGADPNADRDTETLIERMHEELLNACNIRVFFAVGGIYANLMEISSAYGEARLALEYKRTGETGQAVWYHQIPQATGLYYYPIDLEQRLINLAKAGEVKQIQNVLDQIGRENLDRKLSPEMTGQLLYAMKGTALRLIGQINLAGRDQEIQETLGRIDPPRSFEDNFNLIRGAYQAIGERTNEQKKSHNARLAGKIIEYIGRAWPESDLCLQKVAAEFALSEGYLSHFFKEQTGENFTSYLERLRIDKACAMLDDQKLTIAEIAEKVGYNSPQAFRRAFKRVTGTNPTGYSG